MRQSSCARILSRLARSAKIALSVSLLVALGLGTRESQAATAPANDLMANATVVTSLPFGDAIDVSGATSDADDTAALGPCFPGIPIPINNSVWYSYTAPTDTNLVVDLRATNFSTGLVIAERQGGTLGRRLCWVNSGANDRYVMQVSAGVSVSILIFNSGPPNVAGNLAVSIYAATVPANDTIGGATVIPSLPFSDSVDPIVATTDADDAQIGDTCGWAPIHSVWYVFTAGPDDTSVLFSTPAGPHVPHIGVATGSPGALNTIGCNFDRGVIVPTSPGTTYYVLVDSGSDPLHLEASHPPPAPAISAQFTDEGQVDRAGVAHLSGTYKCSNASSSSISAIVTQTHGHHVLTGFIYVGLSFCDARRHAFLATAIEVEGGRFTPGRMLVRGSATACGVGYPCTFTPFESEEVHLSPDVFGLDPIR